MVRPPEYGWGGFLTAVPTCFFVNIESAGLHTAVSVDSAPGTSSYNARAIFLQCSRMQGIAFFPAHRHLGTRFWSWPSSDTCGL